ncbi:MAG: alkaline phosphatase [Planctomycetaceae bacterium]|nr:alkaline phosphatase [Planctomycetaceae bacterium]
MLRSTLAAVVSATLAVTRLTAADPIRDIQNAAIEQNKSPVAHWGLDPEDYTQWTTHSLRLIPVYTFGTACSGPGVNLCSHIGRNSPYRTEQGVTELYGHLPTNTLNATAEYGDQVCVGAIQRAAAKAGKKHIFLVIFDGMDWQTTQAAAIYNAGRVGYTKGRGTGLHFLDYTAGGTTQYGFVVTAPANDGTNEDVNTQTVDNPGGTRPGGYNAVQGGGAPWDPGANHAYRLGKDEHPYPDSANTATALCTGEKSYNGAINVDVNGNQLATVAHDVQQQGWAIGVVTSVPISHATPSAAYAHNVGRDDYQDLTRDLLGLPSIAHPNQPLAGVDVLIGTGFGDVREEAKGQGNNFVPGNAWITAADQQSIDVAHGGAYVVAQRTAGADGTDVLQHAADQAAAQHARLFGFFGHPKFGHLPFRTADGDYVPAKGPKGAEEYTSEDLTENPTLAEMTAAALTVLQDDPDGSWLMVEAGDVDWANHDDNLDNSIGAVISGDMAIKVITDWVETHSNWNESLLIVTADHGHDLNLLQPEVVAAAHNPDAGRHTSAK